MVLLHDMGQSLAHLLAEHHRKISYQEEIREIFERHRVAFDERYVWD